MFRTNFNVRYVILDVKKTKDGISDSDLVNRIKAGEKELLEQLYERYAEKVYRKCLGLTQDSNTAKDLTHDIFIKIITKLNTFKGKSTFSLWVHSISHNHCINYLVKEKRVKFEDLEQEQVSDITISDIESEHEGLSELQVSQLKKIMMELNPIEREILLLRYQEELSIKEISITLGIGESATKMRLKRSRDRLAQLLTLNKNNHG